MSEPPPYPSQPERHEPDPSWPPPQPGYVQQQPPVPQYYAPRAYIPPGVTLSSWGRRLAAYMIDNILQMVLTLGVAIGVGFGVYGLATGSDRDSAGWAAGVVAYLLLTFAWWLLYAPLTMRRQGAHNGQTWAKQWLGIRVVREDGNAVTAGTAYIRDVIMQDLVFGFVGSFVFSIPWLLDGLWPLWDDRNQALHDKVANTFVINT